MEGYGLFDDPSAQATVSERCCHGQNDPKAKRAGHEMRDAKREVSRPTSGVFLASRVASLKKEAWTLFQDPGL
jgi:hypothetical protein